MAYLANNTNLTYGPHKTPIQVQLTYLHRYINKIVWDTYETVHAEYDSVTKKKYSGKYLYISAYVNAKPYFHNIQSIKN